MLHRERESFREWKLKEWNCATERRTFVNRVRIFVWKKHKMNGGFYYSTVLFKYSSYNGLFSTNKNLPRHLMLTLVLILDNGIVFVVIGEQDQPWLHISGSDGWHSTSTGLPDRRIRWCQFSTRQRKRLLS